MEITILFLFVIGYFAITLEHSLGFDKLIPALLMMCLSWAVLSFGIDGVSTWFSASEGNFIQGFSAFSHEEKQHLLSENLLHHFGKTAEILIFLIGAMTIVEMIDHFDGFQVITKLIKTQKSFVLLVILSTIGFVLSAIIDNLTATIVLITITRKIVADKELRMYFAGFIIIAANAGGAWSPIGDVTTTMLWLGNKISVTELIKNLILPSIVCLLVPLTIARFMKVFKRNFEAVNSSEEKSGNTAILIFGLALIIFVPIFKTITHLPPYMGMMLSLAMFALVCEIASKRQFKMTELEKDAHKSPTLAAIANIETPSILFFLGILMTVACMESLGMIYHFGQSVSSNMNENTFVSLLGLGSAIVDNVPLVAASMGMFGAKTDALIWHKIAYAAGTGGSVLIIGSAAGVVAMGMENISFSWYLKKIAWLALVGYLSGMVVFLF